MASSSTSTSSDNLFRNAHNVPLKCFIQLDAKPDQATELNKLLEDHGANVSAYLDEALVILVDPPTSGGQKLIREFGSDPNRAVLDFGWVRKCVDAGRCIGPGDGWGGHRLPVLSINDFFSSGSAPAAAAASSSSRMPSGGGQAHRAYSNRSLDSASVHRNQHHHPAQGYTPYSTGGALPSPAVSHSAPLSPTLNNHIDGPDGGAGPDADSTNGGALEWHSWSPPDATPDDGAPTTRSSRPPTPEPEPEAPDQSEIVMHHNGMGAKFTDADAEYIRVYFRWSQKHHPERTNRQVLEYLHDRMPYHSAISTAQFIRRHADRFPEYKKIDEKPGSKKKGPQPGKDYSADLKLAGQMEVYDPSHVDEEGCPLPPKTLIPFATGFRFTVADTQYVVAFFNWYLARHPEATRAHILRELTTKAPYRSLPSWSNFFHKNQDKWRHLIPRLADEKEGESPSTPTGSKRQKKSPYPAMEVDVHIVNEADARRWNPTRRQSAHNKSFVPTPMQYYDPAEGGGDEEDEDYDDAFTENLTLRPGGRGSASGSTFTQESSSSHHHHPSRAKNPKVVNPSYYRSPATTTTTTATEKPRRADYGTKRTSKAFTAQERQVFVEFLADHPWVWSHATAKSEWLVYGTTASATWQKFERQQPHRSDACWREYHKRNAEDFDVAAKQIRLAKEEGRPLPPAYQPPQQPTHGRQGRAADATTMDDYEAEDHDPVDQDGDDAYEEDELDGMDESGELPGSSFSYAPVPVQPEPEPEPIAMEEDQDMMSEEDVKPHPPAARAAGSASAQWQPGPSSNSSSKAASGPKAGAGRGKGGSRRGRAYVPFTKEQKERFEQFLVDHPQVWNAATPEQGWVSPQTIKEGKDATWKQLAALPGMDDHSYKSWREYHRVRAVQFDNEAKAKRLARDAAATRPQQVKVEPQNEGLPALERMPAVIVPSASAPSSTSAVSGPTDPVVPSTPPITTTTTTATTATSISVAMVEDGPTHQPERSQSEEFMKPIDKHQGITRMFPPKLLYTKPSAHSVLAPAATAVASQTAPDPPTVIVSEAEAEPDQARLNRTLDEADLERPISPVSRKRSRSLLGSDPDADKDGGDAVKRIKAQMEEVALVPSLASGPSPYPTIAKPAPIVEDDNQSVEMEDVDDVANIEDTNWLPASLTPRPPAVTPPIPAASIQNLLQGT